MRWSDCAVQDLRKYAALKAGVENIAARVEALEVKFAGIKSANTTETPVTGGESKYEDFLLDNIVERERLKLLSQADRLLLAVIDRGLAALNDTERRVLDRFFIHRIKDHVPRLTKELHLEQSQIYRIKDQALYKFTVNMYGIEDY